MSNLLKFSNVIVTSAEKRVIDSNESSDILITKNAEKYNFAKKAEVPDSDGFICGLEAATVEEVDNGTETVDNSAITEAYDDARIKADDIIQDAKNEAEDIRNKAYKEGYSDGQKTANSENDKLKSDLKEQLENEYSEKLTALEEEYKNKKLEMEPELVNTLSEVFSKITYAFAEENKDIVFYLANQVLHNSEMCHNFTIKVSPEDYDFMLDNKEKLYGASSNDITIDIRSDSDMKKNQCIIETDAGVFDCGLDTELNNLIKELRLLSCLNN